MYSRVCLLCIIVAISLGYVASKAGVEENDKKFSVNFDVIHPRDRNCKLMSNQSKCEVDLSGIVDSARVANIDGAWYVITIKIGEAKQAFKVQLDSGSDLLWVFGDNCLDADNDNCRGHSKYVLDKDAEYKAFELDYEVGKVSGKEVIDVVHVTDKLPIEGQLFGAAGDVNEEYRGLDGVMGLNMDILDQHPSVIYNMIAQKLITEPSYSLYLKGGKTAEDGGEITFGGRNEDLLVPDSGVKAKMLPGHEIMAKMTSLKLGEHFYCSEDVDKCRVLVDSGCTAVSGSEAFVDNIHQEIEAGEEGVVDCIKVDTFPTIEIMFGESQMTLESKYYIEKHQEKCYSLIEKADEEDYDWLFGIPLFVKYYIEFDFTKEEESICFWTKK